MRVGTVPFGKRVPGECAYRTSRQKDFFRHFVLLLVDGFARDEFLELVVHQFREGGEAAGPPRVLC